LIGPGGTDGINCRLVIRENKVRVHVMRLSLVIIHDLCLKRGMISHLIHKSENNLLIRGKSPSKFTPELAELSSSGCFGVSSITDDASCSRLLRRIVVSHVVVWIQDTISSFCNSDIVYCIGELGIILETN
jgi:hypothetical protein